jgi:hypothetical protein
LYKRILKEGIPSGMFEDIGEKIEPGSCLLTLIGGEKTERSGTVFGTAFNPIEC